MLNIIKKSQDVIIYIATICIIIFLFYLGNKNLGYNWQIKAIPSYFLIITESGWQIGPLLVGLKITIIISAISLILTVIIGFISAVLSMSNSISGLVISKLYVEIIRNTPILIQLFLFYYILSPIIGLDRFWTAVLCLSFFEGAYSSEIIRGGIQAISKSQWEAGYSLGLNKRITLVKIIMPQSAKIIIPLLTNQFISLIKNSSIVSVIAILDLVAVGRNLIAENFLSFEIWFTIAAIYFILNTVLSLLITYIDKKYFSF